MTLGIQKAALLLTMLDSGTAKELLKGQPPEMVQRIAMELSRFDGHRKKSMDKAAGVTREFCNEIFKTCSGGLHIKSFVGSLLKEASGLDNNDAVKDKLQQQVIKSNPYSLIAEAPATHLSTVLENENPQTIAVVLSSVPPKLSTEVLKRLDDEKASTTVWLMTQASDVSLKTILRIGEMVCKRLLAMKSEEGPVTADKASDDILRKVALVLSGLDKEKRDVFVKTIKSKNDTTANTVCALMVTWEDIARIEDKSLQQVLRNLEATVLAKALRGAEPDVSDKILSNISDRMKALIEEEESLLGDVRKKDILAARENVVKPLREANEAEELHFVEEEDGS
jgi:flagellar motor switch protein FliG